MSAKRIVIVGGGVIGMASAWYCRQRGHHVTVIDREPARRDGCSFGNAGMIVPSHFIPLAAPGMIRMGLKWMCDRESPFYIRPRLSLDLIRWLWQFRRACNPSHVQRSAPLLRDLHLASRQCFQQMQSDLGVDFGLVSRGLLMLCRERPVWEEEVETSELAQKLGLKAQVLSPDELRTLEPGIDMDVRGGVYYPDDCHLSPKRLMDSMQRSLSDRGVDFVWESEVQDFVHDGSKVRAVVTDAGEIAADEVLICSGIWSSQIARQLDLSLPMQAGKGYSVTVERPPELPEICSILTEARVAVTPIGTSLRFAGTMEIAGIDRSITASRVRGIVRSIRDYFPNYSEDVFADCQPWAGLRPCSPDGLPYLGRPRRWGNVIISTGHAMMGISLAMISGRLVAEIVDAEPPSIDNLQLLSPDRYS